MEPAERRRLWAMGLYGGLVFPLLFFGAFYWAFVLSRQIPFPPWLVQVWGRAWLVILTAAVCCSWADIRRKRAKGDVSPLWLDRFGLFAILLVLLEDVLSSLLR